MAQIDMALNQSTAIGDAQSYRFRIGEALFCPLRRQVTIAGEAHLLEPRVNQLLSTLIEADLPMSRESLLDKIWGKDGSDEALTQAVSKLRRALGDKNRPYRVIETLPKLGYQLSAPVELERLEDMDISQMQTTGAIKGLSVTLPRLSSFWTGLGIGASAMLIGVVGWSGFVGERSREVEIECPVQASGEECLAIVQAVVAHQ